MINTLIHLLLEWDNTTQDKPLRQLFETLLYVFGAYLFSASLSSEDLKKSILDSKIDPQIASSVLSVINNNNIINDNNMQTVKDNNIQPAYTLGNLESKLALLVGEIKDYLDWFIDPTEENLLKTVQKKAGFPAEREKYLKYTNKKEITDYTEFVYWLIANEVIKIFLPDDLWGKLVPPLVQIFVDKGNVASLLVSILKDYNILRQNLIITFDEMSKIINQSDFDNKDNLSKFIFENLVGSAKEFIQGLEGKDLGSLPPFEKETLLTLLKTDNESIKDTRDILLENSCFVALSRVLLNDKGQLSSDKMMQVLHGVVQEYQGAKNDLEIATYLFDQVFDQTFWDGMFHGVMKGIFNRDIIILTFIKPRVAEIRKSIETLKEKENEADAFLNGDGMKKHGINQLLAQAFYSLDAMIDEYPKMDGKIAEDQPLLINDLIKKAFGSGQTAPIIKDAIHSIIKIALHEKLIITQGDDSQKKVIQLVKDIVGVFKSPNSIQKLLELLLPEKLVKEIVPPSLINLFYKVKDDLSTEKEFTLSKIVEWFFKKDSEEIESIKKNYINYTLPVQNDPKIQRLTGWIERLLGDQKMIEDLIFENGQINEDIGSYLDIVMDEIKPHVGELLKPKFLSYVLNEALKDVNAIQFPLRADGVIMNDAEREKFFNDEVGNKFISIILKNAKKPFPSMAETALKSAVVSAMENFTKKNNRVVFVNNFIKPPNNPIMDGRIQGLASQIDKVNPPANFDEAAFLRENEIIFKKNIAPFARKKIDEYVDSQVNWSGFRKWITRLCYKIVVSLVMNISLKHRIWRFVSDPNSDVVIQKIIWKFLTVADNYKGEDVVEGSLTEAFKGFFEQQNLIPGMIRGLLAKKTAAWIFPQDIVDLVAPVPPAQPAQAVV